MLFTSIALVKSRSATPRRASKAIRRRRTRPARGQVLPMMRMGLMVFLMFATLLIDGSMMMQAQRDLEVIAEHAAQSGGQRINYRAYVADCPGSATTPATCADRLTLAADADDTARATANNWIAQNEANNLSLPGRAPTNGSVTATLAPGNVSVTVTVRRCYEPFLINFFTGTSQGCSNATLIEATSTYRPIGGN